MQNINTKYTTLTETQLNEEFNEWFAQIGYLTEDADYDGVVDFFYGQLSSRDASLTTELLDSNLTASKDTVQNIYKNSLIFGKNTNLVNYENGNDDIGNGVKNNGEIDKELLKLIKYTFTSDIGMFDMGEYMWKGLIHLSNTIQNYTMLNIFHQKVVNGEININKLKTYEKFCNKDKRNYGEKFMNIYNTYMECFSELNNSQKLNIDAKKKLELTENDMKISDDGITNAVFKKTFNLILADNQSWNPFNSKITPDNPLTNVTNVYFFLRTIVLNKLCEEKKVNEIEEYLNKINYADDVSGYEQMNFKKSHRFLYIYKYLEHIKSYYQTIYPFYEIYDKNIVVKIDELINKMIEIDLKKLESLKDEEISKISKNLKNTEKHDNIEKIIKLIENFKGKRDIHVYKQSNTQTGGNKKKIKYNEYNEYNQYGGAPVFIVSEYLKTKTNGLVVETEEGEILYGLPTTKTFQIKKDNFDHVVHTVADDIIEFNSVDIFVMMLVFIKINSLADLKIILPFTGGDENVYINKIIKMIFNENGKEYKKNRQIFARNMYEKLNNEGKDSFNNFNSIKYVEKILIMQRDFNKTDDYLDKGVNNNSCKKDYLKYLRIFDGVDETDQIFGVRISTLKNDKERDSLFEKVKENCNKNILSSEMLLKIEKVKHDIKKVKKKEEVAEAAPAEDEKDEKYDTDRNNNFYENVKPILEFLVKFKDKPNTDNRGEVFDILQKYIEDDKKRGSFIKKLIEYGNDKTTDVDIKNLFDVILEISDILKFKIQERQEQIVELNTTLVDNTPHGMLSNNVDTKKLAKFMHFNKVSNQTPFRNKTHSFIVDNTKNDLTTLDNNIVKFFNENNPTHPPVVEPKEAYKEFNELLITLNDDFKYQTEDEYVDKFVNSTICRNNIGLYTEDRINKIYYNDLHKKIKYYDENVQTIYNTYVQHFKENLTGVDDKIANFINEFEFLKKNVVSRGRIKF
jgi:hypothetical protein